MLFKVCGSQGPVILHGNWELWEPLHLSSHDTNITSTFQQSWSHYNLFSFQLSLHFLTSKPKFIIIYTLFALNQLGLNKW
jgi:hypothetical protein